MSIMSCKACLDLIDTDFQGIPAGDGILCEECENKDEFFHITPENVLKRLQKDLGFTNYHEFISAVEATLHTLKERDDGNGI
jgi:hypothetical protein